MGVAQATDEWETLGQDHCVERLEERGRAQVEAMKTKGSSIPQSLEVGHSIHNRRGRPAESIMLTARFGPY